jgi:hypothetical protein
MLARLQSVDARESLRSQGYALLSADGLAATTTVPDIASLESFVSLWSDLPRDPYLRDGGRYRMRRHSCFVQDCRAHRLRQVEHRAHWQSTAYNALHGGMLRWFEPMAPTLTASPGWSSLLLGLGDVFAAVRPEPEWYIEAHQFRIDTAGGVGRPTPEGAHRDGVSFVAVVMVARHGVSGGETRVFDAEGPHGVRFTMSEPWCALLLDDTRVIHETTPLQPLPDAAAAYRDTLVLTYRADGFQEPGSAG